MGKSPDEMGNCSFAILSTTFYFLYFLLNVVPSKYAEILVTLLFFAFATSFAHEYYNEN
jgi:hypothetical protein